jgi:hypothetical protein
VAMAAAAAAEKDVAAAVAEAMSLYAAVVA